MKSGFKIGRITFTTTIMIWLVLAITSVGSLVISTFHTSNFVYYLADAFNVFLALFAIRRMHGARKTREVGFLVVLLWLFVINCFMGIIGNNVPLKLAIWGSRNVYRFILFFISCTVLLEKKMLLDFEQHFQKYMYSMRLLLCSSILYLGLKVTILEACLEQFRDVMVH